MNWYKYLILKVGQRVKSRQMGMGLKPVDTYTNIGHNYGVPMGIKNPFPNYLWIYNNIDKKIESKEETKEAFTHSMAFHHIKEGTYMGRYESRTGRLSIVSPYKKKHMSIPSVILWALRQTFPDYTQIYEF